MALEIDALRQSGAYPVREGGQWHPHPNLKAADGIIKDYFERSMVFFDVRDFAIQIQTARSMRHWRYPDQTGHCPTFKTGYPHALEHIKGQGGAFIGTGMTLGVTYPVVQEAKRAFLLNINPAIPFGYAPVENLLTLMGKTPAEFVSLVLGKPLSPSEHITLLEMSGMELLRAFDRVPHDPAFEQHVTETAVQMIREKGVIRRRGDVLGEFREPIERSVRGALMALRAPSVSFAPEEGGSALSLMTLANQKGQGGLLSSPEMYKMTRAFQLEERTTGVLGNLFDPQWGFKLVGALHRRMMKLGVFDLSALERNFADADLSGLSFGHFYRGLEDLDLARQTLVIYDSSRTLSHVSPLEEYLDLAMPSGRSLARRGELAKSLVPLRMAGAGVIGDLISKGEFHSERQNPSDLLRTFIKRIGADQGLSELKQPLRGLLFDYLDRVVAGKKKPLAYEESHWRMLRHSRLYRETSTQPEQDYFQRNLVDLGIVRSPRSRRDFELRRRLQAGTPIVWRRPSGRR